HDSHMYRTGDFARILDNGELEYLGRIDDQVKIRGYRIELGEIESCLSSLEGVNQSVVLVKEHGDSKHLVAYIDGLTSLDKTLLEESLKTVLPDYMIPRIYVIVDGFKLTSSGKIDKKILPDPGFEDYSVTEYVAPETDLEHKLVAIWMELLGLDRVGVKDDFFSLGGHSLLAIRLASSIRNVFGVEFPVKMIFTHPTIVLMSQKFSTLERTSIPLLTTQSRPDRIPLSFAQERLWFLDRLSGSSNYHIPAVLKLENDVDLVTLENSLRNILISNEVLRTVIFEEGGAGYQQILEVNNFVVSYHKEIEPNKLSNYITDLVEVPFDLSSDYMLRADLIITTEGARVLVCVMHHIASDGWSLPLLFQELSNHYRQFSKGLPSKTISDGIQYADYSIWQRGYIEGSILDEKLTYWKNSLQGVAVLTLPTDYTRPLEQSFKGGRYDFVLDKEVVFELRELIASTGSSLFITLLGVFNVFLNRYSGQRDICIGTPVANRGQKEVESLIGFFVNTLALRNELDVKERFIDLLSRVKKNTLEAYDYQDVPFEKVVNSLGLERDSSRTPLFQVMLSLQNNQGVSSDFELGDLDLEAESFDFEVSKYDLVLNIIEDNDFVSLSFSYCTDLFKSSTIERMAEHFVHLTKEIVSSPDKTIGSYQMLTSKDQKELLEDFNSTEVSYPKDVTVLDVFKTQVASNPENIALVYENDSLSYGDLDHRSSVLAKELTSKGLEKGDLAAICMNRSMDMIVGILGILKSGGAYVPIDPSYPKDRISYILEDTSTSILITNSSTIESLDVEDSLEVFTLDLMDLSVALEDYQALELTGEDLAYVIYTSGSTGRPKGVLTGHDGLINLCFWHQRVYEMEASSRSLLISGEGFDASVWEIFPNLCSGSSLHVISNDQRLDIGYLIGYINTQNITHSYLPPALYNSILHYQESVIETEIKFLVGGEALNIDKHLNKVQLYNNYGPSENSVVSSYTYVSKEDTGLISIGKPIDNVEIYILDDGLNLLPIGVVGEICVSGKGLSRGYLNNEELTKEKFVSHPFKQGERMYRTGDLGRWLSDGTIEFIGRKDDQVKIRGYRIELGEIESCLSSLEGVNQSVVLVKEHGDSKHLVAYIDGLATLDKTLLEESLKTLLPDYMIPRIYVIVDGFKLTSNGKIDKKALPEPALEDYNVSEYVAPSSEEERKMVQVWEGLLGLEQVGVTDNFFSLGGDSIIAIQLVSRAKNEDLHFKVSDVFTYQTIAQIVSKISTFNHVDVEKGHLTGPVGLLPIQQMFVDLNYADYNHYNQSLLLSVLKDVSNDDLLKIISLVCNRHDTFRLSFEFDANGQLQQSYGEVIPELISEVAQDEEDVTRLCEQHQKSLNILKGEVVKFIRIKTTFEKDKDYLFIVVHHLAIDGVSWRILFDDFEKLFTDLKKGVTEPKLDQKSSSYRQWYNELYKFAQSDFLQKEKEYWLKVLSASETPPLSYDINYTKETTFKDTRHLSFSLNKESTKNLLQKVHGVYGTEINDLLLSAIALVLNKKEGKDKIVIGLEGHGREQLFENIDISRTTGWFTTLFPVLLTMPNQERDIKNLIIDTKEMLRSIPNRGIGFGLLKYLVDDENIRNEFKDDFHHFLFNYLGSFDNSFDKKKTINFVNVDKGSDISLSNKNVFNVAVNCLVLDGELQVNWSYDSNRYEESTIKQLAKSYIQVLEELVDHCLEQEPVKTPYDYGLPISIKHSKLEEFKGLPSHQSRIKDIYPLTSLQNGMLFHTLFSSEGGAYIIQFSMDFVKGLDFDLFKSTWQYLFQKHSILRTGIFPNYFGIPVQAVFEDVNVPIKAVDFSNEKAGNLEQKIKELFEKDSVNKFDLTQAPLLRFTLLRLPNEKVKMILTYHHALWDGWSFSLLMSSFIRIYLSLLKGKELPNYKEDNFGDLVRALQLKDLRKSNDYWSEYLSILEEPTHLPFVKDDAKRNKVFGSKISTLEFDQDFTSKLRDYTKKNSLTINTLIQGSWSYLLSRYTDNDAVAFGATVSGRNDIISDIEDRVGLYINTIPVVTKINKETKVLEWLKELQEDHTISREEHGSISYTNLRTHDNIKGALFDTILVFENYPVDPDSLNTEDLFEIENIKTEEYGNFVISLSIAILENQLIINFTYTNELIDDSFISMIQNHLKSVLSDIIREANNISDINLLNESEKLQIVKEFNDTYTDFPKDRTIVELFKEEVAKNPNKNALAFKGQVLSYTELDEKSNKLCNYLIGRGIKSQDKVGILSNRNTDMIVSILAILKCGGVYVPLNSEFPSERLQYIIRNAGIKEVVCTDESLINEKRLDDCNIILISDWKSQSNEENLVKVNQDSLAYIMYTSGTTGNSKGVKVSHRNIIKLVYDENEIAVNSNDKVLQWSNFAFDGSTYEIFSALLKGASLSLITQEEASSAIKLTDFIEKEAITVVFMTTALFNASIDYNASAFYNVRKLLFGGELVSVPHVKKALDVLGKNKLVHVYGPTETVVYATLHPINEVIGDIVPIGKPLSNTHLYILNSFDELCPIGVEGELLIGGAGVSLGYLDDQELTEQKFINNWLEPQNPYQLYRTGDRVKWLPDGSVDFIGRKDFQVKIRGYRIEIGEIEKAIQGLDSIEQVVVVAEDDPSGSKRLISYIVSNVVFDKKSVTNELKEKLPDYMVPSFIIPMESLPLTPNGKIDKKKLSISLRNHDKEKNENSGLTNLQLELLNIWKTVLRMDQINIEDEFFDLGGHSLIASEMVSLIKNKIKVDLSIKDIFLNDSIAKLSDFISESSDNVETELLQIWKEALQLEEIDIHEEFFDLGGHSLIASQMINMIKNKLHVDLNLKDVFIHDTVFKLANFISETNKSTEEILLNIWEEVLKVDEIDIEDEFFDLGGHSLLATQILARIKDTLNLDLEIKDIFIHDSVAKLTSFIDSQENKTQTKLIEIWQDVLELDTILPDEDFFDLGGHSLLATQIVSEVSSQFKISLEIKDLFLNSTVSELTNLINDHEEIEQSSEIVAVERPELVPLSFAQESLWFIDQLEGSQHYHIPVILRLNGSLDIEVLEYAISEVVDRHEILRSVYKKNNGKGFQQLLEKGNWSFDEITELKSLESLDSLINECVLKPFNLSSDFMLRGHLIMENTQDHILVLVFHHIAADGSLPIFFEEFSTLYNSKIKNASVQLTNLEIQYADYAIWQRNYFDSMLLENKLSYWENKLEGISSFTLPLDYTRPAIQSNNGANITRLLDPDLSLQLISLAKEKNVTLYILTLSIFNTLLSKYSNKRDICIGSPVANRNKLELKSLIGFFVNTIALRNKIDYDWTFEEFLNEVKNSTLSDFEYQDVPFEKVINKLNIERDRSRSPIFQVFFSLQNSGFEDVLTLDNLDVAWEKFDYNISKYDLTLNVIQKGDSISLAFEYCTDLFKSSTIERMAEHFVHLTKEIVSSPDKTIGSYQMLTSKDQKELLEDFNSTEVSYPKDVTVLDVFKTQVASNPENIALVYGDDSLRYGDLDHRSSVLAKELIDKGVKKGDLAAICMNRSMEMIVGILGVLKSGGAYVPIDPSYPKDRISYILEDTSTSILITN
ncbi:MAG: amino acid adenylation domain-containing protein, partial [Flavobacteriaceae bacterium]